MEPYFPKHVFSYINLKNLVLFLECKVIFDVTALTMKMSFENAQNHVCQISETPPTLQSMDKNKGFPNIIMISYY